MILRRGIFVLFVGFLLACGDGEAIGGGDGDGAGGAGGQKGTKHPWAGRWQGTVFCQGYEEDSEGRKPYQGQVTLEAQFDANGNLLLPAGNDMVPQTHEGQLDKWVPSGGGVFQRLLKQFQDNGDHRVYVFQQSYESTDTHGSYTSNLEEGYDLRIEGNTLRGSYQMFERKVSIFVSEFGSAKSESIEEAQCQGELKR